MRKREFEAVLAAQKKEIAALKARVAAMTLPAGTARVETPAPKPKPVVVKKPKPVEKPKVIKPVNPTMPMATGLSQDLPKKS